MATKFARPNADEVRKAMDEKVGGSNFLKLKEGRNELRLLPVTETALSEYGRKEPFVEIWVHFLPSSNKSIACLKNMGKAGSCEVCRTLKRITDRIDEDELNGMKAKKRYRCNVWNIDTQSFAIWEPGWTVVRDISKIFNEWGDITDVEDGRSLIVNREGTGRFTKYSVSVGRNTGALPDVAFDWFENNEVTELEETINYPSADDLRDAKEELLISAGLMDDLDDDEDEDVEPEPPKRSKPVSAAAKVTSRKPAPAAVVEDEDDDDYNEDDEDEDDDDLPWDDDDDDDDDEIVEPEPPKRTSFSRSGTTKAAAATATPVKQSAVDRLKARRGAK